MLVVEADGAFDGFVAYGVAMGEILGQDAGTRLVLLR